MKWWAGIAIGLGLMVLATVGCAHWRSDWEAKCGPQVDPLTKPCSCFDARTPTCPPPPNDDTKRTADGGSTP